MRDSVHVEKENAAADESRLRRRVIVRRQHRLTEAYTPDGDAVDISSGTVFEKAAPAKNDPNYGCSSSQRTAQ